MVHSDTFSVILSSAPIYEAPRHDRPHLRGQICLLIKPSNSICVLFKIITCNSFTSNSWFFGSMRLLVTNCRSGLHRRDRKLQNFVSDDTCTFSVCKCCFVVNFVFLHSFGINNTSEICARLSISLSRLVPIRSETVARWPKFQQVVYFVLVV